MTKGTIAVLTLVSAFIFQSSMVYVPSHPPRAYIDIKEGIESPMSLYGFHAKSVWQEADAIEVQYNLPTDLLKALILWESGGKLNAYNRNKDKSIDRGPVQLNSACLPRFERVYNNGEPINPNSLDSVRIAGKLLMDHYKRYGSWRSAVQHYNYHAKGYADSVFSLYLKLKGLD